METSSLLTRFVIFIAAIMLGLYILASIINQPPPDSSSTNTNSTTTVNSTVGTLDFRSCASIQCPAGGNNGNSTPPVCPTVLKQIDISAYLNALPKFDNSSLIGRPSDKILSLVAIAENSSTDWQKQINYIEDIKDGRGYTVSIVGFCSGTGDFKQVVQRVGQLNPSHPLVQFLPALETVDGTPCLTGLSSLPSVLKSLGTTDTLYNQAVFDIVGSMYWKPAIQYASANNLKSPLSQYIIYDTLLNFGQLDMFKAVRGTTERDFLNNFLDTKECMIRKCKSLGSPGYNITGQNNRVDLQRSLLTKGNYNLTSPMSLNCYGDSYTL